MSSLPPLNTISNGTLADAGPVEENFSTLATFVTEELINSDGSVAMTEELTLSSSTPSGPLVAASKGYVDAHTPPGVMHVFAGTVAPAGYLMCVGQALSRSTYSALFAVIGTTHGAGDGSTTFNLPDMRGRFPVGRDSGDSSFNTVGETGGSKNAIAVSHTHAHTLGTGNDTHGHTTDIDHNHGAVNTSGSGNHSHQTAAQDGFVVQNMTTGSNSVAVNSGSTTGASNATTVTNTATAGNHTHSVDLPALGSTLKTSSNDTHNHSVTGSITSAGSSGTNANLPPYIALNFIIKT